MTESAMGQQSVLHIWGIHSIFFPKEEGLLCEYKPSVILTQRGNPGVAQCYTSKVAFYLPLCYSLGRK